MFRYVTLSFAFALSVGLLPVFLGTERAEAVSAPPQGFTDTSVAANTGQPVALTFTPDGRMLVADKPGRLQVYGTDGTPLANPALDLTAKVCTGERSPGRQDERGLLGVAVDPYFQTNGYVYLYYTYKKFPNAANPCPYRDPDSPVNRVSRFKMSGNTVDPSSEAVLVDNISSTAGSHNAGDVKFGKDGYLYVSVGDGGCDYAATSNCGGFNDAAQDTHALVGKILRVTRGGAIPPTNPYTNPETSERCGDRGDDGRTDPGKRCQEVFASGLRNPFRMAFDPDADRTRFFINDVGQFAWEEIDLGKRGADYGWNFCEGRHDNPDRPGTPNCAAPFTPPVHEYNHDPLPDRSECRSITGGAFVPDAAGWPASYEEGYLFGDYICNKIFMITPESGGGFTRTEFSTGLADFGPISLAFGPSGPGKALYYTTFANGGEIRRISFTG